MTRSSFVIPVLLQVLGVLSASPAAQADGFEGIWCGEARMAGGTVFVQVELVEGAEAGEDTAIVTIPALGALGVEARSIEKEADGLKVEARAPVLSVGVSIGRPEEGRASATLDILTGPARLVDLPPATFDVRSIPKVRGLPGASRHDAILALPGNTRLPITIVLGESDGVELAMMDIPAQGLQGIVLLPGSLPIPGPGEEATPLESNPDLRVWRLPVQVEAQLLIRPEGDSWTGAFRQGQFDLPIQFERAAEGAVAERRRPQDPVPPLPYAEVDVEVATPAGHVLAGTLVIPGTDPDENGFPAVVLVTGSGPQNRDEELLGHRPFLVLADRLARMGIASFRYDDRGVGASTGEFSTATGFDLADDVAAALGYLKRAPGVDCDRCGVAGHSEGGLLAAIVAAGMAPSFPEAAPAFVVSIAGTGVDGGAILSDQSARILRAAGADEDVIRDIDAAHRALMDAMRNEEVEPAVIEPLLAELQDRQLALQGVELDEADLAELRQAGMAQMGSPWMRAFIRFDPAIAWRSVRVPALAVNGTLDLQVWHDLNLPAIERAVRGGGGAVEIVRFEGLNHMLQPTTTGSPDEYAIIDTTMDEAAMETLGSWILSTPRRPVVSNRGGE